MNCLRRYAFLSLVLGSACFPFPNSLDEAGLYDDIEAGTLADGVREYRPRFELWSDGAEKRRFVLLPDGETIDTSDMDFWQFPIGTKFFKEFSRGGVRLETRLLQRLDNGDWTMVAYLWNAEQTGATAVPAGTENAHGTAHDVPALVDCGRCHEGAPGRVLGFSALQLAHDEGGLTLQTLIDESLLSAPPASALLPLPGDASTQALFGSLHVNCGTCHNATTDLDTALRLFLPIAQLTRPVEETDIYQTTVSANAADVPDGGPTQDKIVEPGDPSASMLYVRATTRGEDWQMPPLATESVDATLTAALEAWIGSL